MTTTDALAATGLTLRYEAREVVRDLDVAIPAGKVTVIIGPNACGKSTLLRALARLLTPAAGTVTLQGTDIRSLGSKDLARRLGLLPQSPLAPFGITVADLVGRGRFPHQRMLQQWSADDERAVSAAMTATGVAEFADRGVEELSGGQRQRVWIAMLLAQDTPVMLLDEPTTYLDVSHQLDVLELCRGLNRSEDRTVVLVLHDLNQAARYADHLIVMKDGAIAAEGDPATVLTEKLLEDVFRLRAHVQSDPVFGTPLVIPITSVTEDAG
ncbi:ABC transporter ATP-binding protein [Microbacterium gorillae]|uniref:ABC transporter ATP-binding protein n=1 Tax=Microbacterium gorillae TaxID=1231063 RepID=UPI0005901392|nr:ABC transporter ATP-binding protein [Microbacterium gorillae]